MKSAHTKKTIRADLTNQRREGALVDVINVL